MSLRSVERSGATRAGISPTSDDELRDFSRLPAPARSRHAALHQHRFDRQKTTGSSGGGPSLPLRTLLCGTLLVVIGYAAASIGSAIFGGGAPHPAAESTTFKGTYLVAASSTDLGSRDATQFSRAAARPAALPGLLAKPKSKAQHKLVKQYQLLRRAAANAEKYAKRLASQEWVYPTSHFTITELFGVPGPHWESGYHTGIDFATAYGTPVVAVGNGTVAQTGWDGPYGNQIRLQLPNGDQVWYNHLSSIEVTPGQAVLKGQQLGRVGDTGNAFGYHLHLEYRLSSDLTTAVNPIRFFREHGLRLQ